MDLRSRITKELCDEVAQPWFPQLAEHLVGAAWSSLYAEIRLTKKNYSTNRMIEKSVRAPRSILATLDFNGLERQASEQIYLEKLPSNIEANFETLGLCFAAADDQAIEYQLSELKLAFDLIANVPSLYRTIIRLVRSVHILDSGSDQHDVSFSDPSIPFSIFISIPSMHQLNSSIRIAEAIVHEAMHLQLTLIDRLNSLVVDDEKKMFSPWKGEDRRPSGILHALYVFSVIYISLPLLLPANDIFISLRQSEIKNQVQQINSFRLFDGLTPLGRLFRDYLFEYFDQILISYNQANSPLA